MQLVTQLHCHRLDIHVPLNHPEDVHSVSPGHAHTCTSMDAQHCCELLNQNFSVDEGESWKWLNIMGCVSLDVVQAN